MLQKDIHLHLKRLRVTNELSLMDHVLLQMPNQNVFLSPSFSWSQKVTGHMSWHVTKLMVVENISIYPPHLRFYPLHEGE